MTIKAFPPVETADEDGLLAVGGDLEPDSIVLAYRSGVFPWPINKGLLAWFAPPERAVLFLDEFHISRSLKRELNHNRFTLKHNTAFSEVIERCAEVKNRGDQGATWITPEMQAAYQRLHELGIAQSFEAYQGHSLVGGVYGIRIDNFFAAESSFYRVDNASKVVMVALARYLEKEGIPWFDCQVLTPFSESFGAREIPRAEFMKLLGERLHAAGTTSGY
jgi:leucyl/phenylalanyl-tRNA--protein transferase